MLTNEFMLTKDKYMKRLVLMIMLVASIVSLAAEAGFLASFDASDLMSREALSLRESVRSLDIRGLEVYHYNATHVIAAIPASKAAQYSAQATRLASLPLSGKLYLISKLDDKPFDLPSGIGEQLLDLGESILLHSGLSDVQLRERIPYPFTELEMEPLRFAQDGLSLDPQYLARTDINQMISLVNATSVQGMIQNLQDFVTRYALAPNRLEVAQWIQNKFLSFGMTDVQLFPFQWNNTTQYNVVATITGSIYPGQYIVVGGHHDSTNNHGDPYASAPGADDNASGTVSALEMARVMMQSGYVPRASIRFVTFAAEEFGLWGAKAYSLWAQNNDLDIRLMMNHDMIANNDTPAPNWEVMLMPYDGSLDHNAYAAQITQNYTSLGTFNGNMNSGSSDSHPFWQRGYNVIYFFEADFCPWYHSSDDIVANIDPDYAAEVIKASTAVAATFADMPSAPNYLSVFDAGDGQSLVINWAPVNDPTVTGFRIYYGSQLSDLQGPVNVTGTSYILNGLPQGQVCYVAISTVDSFGNESYRIYSSGVPLVIPQTPLGFTDNPEPSGIALYWDPNQEYDLASYKLYRSLQAGETGDLLATVPNTLTSYIDGNVSGGQHYYYYTLEAVDATGNASTPTLQIRSRPMSMDQGVLVVDETLNLGGATPFQPTDAQADEFYDHTLSGIPHHQIDIEDLYEPMRLADIGIYSSILWHGNDLSNMEYPYTVREMLDYYIAMGGNILFSVYQPSLAFELNSSYPASFPETSFMNAMLGIDTVDYSNAARFKRAVPQINGYPVVEVDPNKSNANFNYHIIRVEGLDTDGQSTTIYDYGSDYADDSSQGVLNNMAVGILNQRGDGKVVTLSFPLYNTHANQARAMVRHIFTTEFGEFASSSDDPEAPQIPALVLEAPHPNPFSASTTLRLKLRGADLPLSVNIYNQRGQLVRKLFSGPGQKNNVLNWDGKDDKGLSVGSGIYLVKVSQGKESVSRKLMLIK